MTRGLRPTLRRATRLLATSTGADALPTEALSAIRCCTADGAAVPSPTLGSGRTHYDPGNPKIDGGKSWFGEQHSCTSVCAKEVYDDPSKYMVTDSGFVPYLRQETPVHDALAATYAEAAAELVFGRQRVLADIVDPLKENFAYIAADARLERQGVSATYDSRIDYSQASSAAECRELLLAALERRLLEAADHEEDTREAA